MKTGGTTYVVALTGSMNSVISTGNIYAAAALTLDVGLTSRRHIFTVVASDKGVPSLSTTATVTILVLDENNKPPLFRYV